MYKFGPNAPGWRLDSDGGMPVFTGDNLPCGQFGLDTDGSDDEIAFDQPIDEFQLYHSEPDQMKIYSNSNDFDTYEQSDNNTDYPPEPEHIVDLPMSPLSGFI